MKSDLTALVACIDLTSLNDHDNHQTIDNLCANAMTPLGNVAAVCVYPKFVKHCVLSLQNPSIKVATVANFPSGEEELSNVLLSIQTSMAEGAGELDVVMPYRAFSSGKVSEVHDFIASCKRVCGDKVLLKVILETGVLQDSYAIREASQLALMAGADFIKTSTGKAATGATPEAVENMLLVIKQLRSKMHHTIGCKVAGGVRTVAQAQEYMDLAKDILGSDSVIPSTFRIGTSGLTDLMTSP